MKESPTEKSFATQPLQLERIVGAVKWSATDQLVAWCQRAARNAQRCNDFDGPDPDGPEFERAAVELLRRGAEWP